VAPSRDWKFAAPAIVAGNSTRGDSTCAHPAYEAPHDVDRGASAGIDRTDVLPGCSFVQRGERDGGGGGGAFASSRCEYMHGYISCSACGRRRTGRGMVLSCPPRFHSTLLNPPNSSTPSSCHLDSTRSTCSRLYIAATRGLIPIHRQRFA
ncbi:hypothetical protein B0H14DRAFT_2983756, partial [Mycena olivaceomarginata]